MAENKQKKVRLAVERSNKQKEARSKKPTRGKQKRSVTAGTGRQGAGPFPFKKGGRS